jgi:hypothetical protein
VRQTFSASRLDIPHTTSGPSPALRDNRAGAQRHRSNSRIPGEQTGKPYLVWQSAKPDKTPIYTLASRKPFDIWQWPVISSIGDWFAAPVIN